MGFDSSFRRGCGVGPPPPTLGSDPNPAALTGAAALAYASRDNAITFQLAQAGPQPLHLAFAVAHAGTGTPGAATLALYLWDPDQTQSWFVVAPVMLPIGEVTQVDVPVVMSALAQASTVSVVLSVASPATGIYAVAVGLSDSATTSSGGGGGGDASAANQLLELAQETATAASTAATASSSATTAAQTTATAASAAATAAAVPSRGIDLRIYGLDQPAEERVRLLGIPAEEIPDCRVLGQVPRDRSEDPVPSLVVVGIHHRELVRPTDGHRGHRRLEGLQRDRRMITDVVQRWRLRSWLCLWDT